MNHSQMMMQFVSNSYFGETEEVSKVDNEN